ncbi:membrane hypothetical protein [Candidatus Zixiibacteriota bacterium]|nr:membrane hypothetical protein [candidate division Zixibacteria bacterium]
MSSKTSQILFLAMFLAAVAGWLLGFFVPEVAPPIKFLGVIFLNALKIAVIPLLAVSVILGVTSLGAIRISGKSMGRYLAYFFLVNGLAVAIGLILVNVAKPGLISADPANLVSQGVGGMWGDLATSLVPSSLFQAWSWGFGLGLLLFSILFGIALAAIGNAGRAVHDFLAALDKALKRFFVYILYFAPLGVLALVANIGADYRGDFNIFALRLGFFALIVVIGLIVESAIVLPLTLKGVSGKDPLQFLSNRGDIIAETFVTGIAFPEKSAPAVRTMESQYNFLSRSGTALYLGVAAVFIAQSFSIALSPVQQLIIFVAAIFGSVIAAGIPFAGIISLVFVLSAVGLPIEGLGLILAADWLLERCRATVDTWSDMVSLGVVAESPETKTVPHPVPSATPSIDSRPQKSYEPRRSRSERSERGNRPVRGGRYDTRGRGGKPGDFQKRDRRSDRNDRGDRKGPKRAAAPTEPSPKDKNIPRENIEKELEKLRKQLPQIQGVPDIPSQPNTEIPPPKKDEFFEEGIPKFDFFPEETGPKEEEKRETQPAENSTPVSGESDQQSASQQEENSESGSDNEGDEPPAEDDTWGRGRKRHPSK